MAEEPGPAFVALGLLHARGQGVPQDYVKAREFFEKSATMTDSQKNLALMYAQGLGVPQDYVIAHQWFEKAAALGEHSAFTNLGALYEHGYGIAPDKNKAKELYKKGCAEDNQQGCYNYQALN
ncbi:tetratricopeptide repeat protein [Oceanisphaera sp. IT1-181]|uniref:tetratricopeptide repeat protein n=1 Tax=Oceanisphaera sp. IT1-181 TaxID=3081199 RepID=UPI0039B66F3C